MKNCIILGCGRSGTSMVAGMLASAGYYNGDNFMTPDESNPKGYYEDSVIAAVNEELLQQQLHASLRSRLERRIGITPPPKGARWLARPSTPTTVRPTEDTVERMQERLSHRPFAFKDPRFCHTLGCWAPHLPQGTRFVVVFREPERTIDSILRRRAEQSADSRFKITWKHAGEVWFRSYRHVLACMNSADGYLFLHFDTVIHGDGAQQLARFTAAEIDGGVADKQLSRSQKESLQTARRVPSSWQQLYQRLLQLERLTSIGPTKV